MLSDRIREARKSAGWTQKKVSTEMGVSLSTYRDWEKGERIPGQDTVMGMAYLFKRSLDWFHGRETPGTGPGFDERVMAVSRLLLLGASSQGVSLTSLLGLDDRTGPLTDAGPAWADFDAPSVTAAGGGGAEAPSNEALVSFVRLAPRWLRQHALNPERCDLISVSGDSMHPTLPDGCVILVDRDSTELREGGVFVLRTPDGLVVKRLRLECPGWVLVSDNPGWEPVPLDADALVVGEVRWAGGFL